MITLQDIDGYGDATAENLKQAIDGAFVAGGKLRIDASLYNTALICATADGATRFL